MIRGAVLQRAWAVALRRPPDEVIQRDGSPYLRRWMLLRKNRWFNVYLHEFVRSDEDEAMHDHPWLFNLSWLLYGSYDEHTPRGVRRLQPGALMLRLGRAVHRVELLPAPGYPRRESPVWTLFVIGPKVREWGFHCPRGWRHWKEFTARERPGSAGRGYE